MVDHSVVVAKETIRYALRILYPEDVDERLRHRLQRRQYKGKGPNLLWHIDGFDKLKPYGFCLRRGIDGYSRRILWLEVGISNTEPAFIAKYFVDCVKAVGVLHVLFELILVQRTLTLLASNGFCETISTIHFRKTRALCMVAQYPIRE